MKGFIGTTAFVGLTLAGVVSAVNNFTNPGPGGNTVIQAGGGVTTITWQVDPTEPTISLLLINAQETIVLLNQQPNTGSYLWSVPTNLPSGTYTFEIGAGAPDSLTGTSESASFVIQACETCSAVPSTAIFTPTGTSQSILTQNTAAAGTGTGSGSSATGTTGTSTGTATVTTGTSTATGSGLTTSTVTSTNLSSSSSSGGSSHAGSSGTSSGSTSSATVQTKSGAVQVSAGGKTWIGVVVGLVCLWAVPMML